MRAIWLFFLCRMLRICDGVADPWQCCRAEWTCLYLMPVLGFAEIWLCALSHLTIPSFGEASSPVGGATRESDGVSTLCSCFLFLSKPWEQEHHECQDAGGKGDLLAESGNPHRNIEGHSNICIFRNHPCNLCEGMKSYKDRTWLPARSPSLL